MNPKLEKLKEQSHIQEFEYDIYRGHAPYYVSVFSEEKFAELIIKECISVVQNRDMGSGDSSDIEIRNCIFDIKNHFGVE